MKTHIKTFALLLLCTILFTGCATYHMSTQSLLEQFSNSRKEEKINYIIAFPFFIPFTVTGNNLRQVTCLDKYEKEHVIGVTNHTGIRITQKDKTRKTFYFDTLIIQDSTINGAKSHFIGLGIKPINLNSIDRIEIQK